MRGWSRSDYRGSCRNCGSSRATRHTSSSLVSVCWTSGSCFVSSRRRASRLRGPRSQPLTVDASSAQVVQRTALLEPLEVLVATLTIRPDIREQYSALFGTKTVNGRTVEVEKLIADLSAPIRDELNQLL